MSVIGSIAGVPLFGTVQEALAWAAANGLRGYHTHNLQGQVGYMGGANHQQATGMPLNTNAPTTTVRSSRSSSSGSSSGGGGGY
mgnify:CR=1 FL=1